MLVVVDIRHVHEGESVACVSVAPASCECAVRATLISCSHTSRHTLLSCQVTPPQVHQQDTMYHLVTETAIRGTQTRR